jgi:outer membrane biosynthesis protein TonB
MFSKPLALLLLALGCLTAAAGGAYVATRHNTTDAATQSAAATTPVAPSKDVKDVAPTVPSSQPVAETEAAVSGKKSEASAALKAEKTEPAPAPVPRRQEAVAPKPSPVSSPAPNARNEPAVSRTVPMNGAGQPQFEPQTVQPPLDATAVTPGQPRPSGDAAKPVEPQPEPPRPAQFEEVILPESSVIGLQLETSLSSDRARVEDRVDARVSRDVMAAGRVAIPAGARVLGSVIEVDRGGKVKTPAHIGIRFHTLVLADGTEVALRTKPIYRDAESPAGTSAKKIGGAAVAGAILGGILGGGKGAAIGSATGAAGGSAAVMAGDRTVVNIPSGSVMAATLSSPATLTVERREQ